LKNKCKGLKTVWQDLLLSGQMGSDKENENKGKTEIKDEIGEKKEN